MMARQTSKILISVKNLLPRPDLKASGPVATRALEVPWTRCWTQPWPVVSLMSYVMSALDKYGEFWAHLKQSQQVSGPQDTVSQVG